MRNWIVLFLLLLAAPCLIVGCGGGGGGGSSSQVVIHNGSAAISGPLSVSAGSTIAFTATVGGAANAPVNWSILEGPSGGTITAAGLYTAPESIGTFHIVATSGVNSTQFATIEVIVLPSTIQMSISPASVLLVPGQLQQFNVTVAGASNPGVTFAVLEIGGGSVTPTGLYTPPAVSGTFHVVATSEQDPHRMVTATISVATAVITPPAAVVGVNGTQMFNVTLSGTSDTLISYSVQEGITGGTISETGLYTAPNRLGTFHIIAADAANPAIRAVATVTVTHNTGVTVAIFPSSTTLFLGGSTTFTATVSGNDNTGVLWSVEEAGGGAIDANGNYTAPTTAGTYHIVATSALDPSKNAVAVVLVQAVGITLAVNPSSAISSTSPLTATVNPGQAITIVATVLGTTNEGVTFRVQPGGAGGTVTSGGVYTAPQTAGVDVVVVTSTSDPTKTATLHIQVQSGSGTVIIQ